MTSEQRPVLIWWPDYIEQSFKRAAEVGDRLFLRRAIADRAYARAELGGGAPNTVLILLDDVGHVNDTSQRHPAWQTMVHHGPPQQTNGTPKEQHQTLKQAAALSQTAEPPEPKKHSAPVDRT